MTKLAAILLAVLAVGCGQQPIRVIHIKNWHWLPRESFVADLRDVEPGLTAEQIDERYVKFLDDLDPLQQEQAAMIRKLALQHRLRAAFYEGITDENLVIFGYFNTAIAQFEQIETDCHLIAGNEKTDDALRERTRALIVQRRGERAQLGAIGRLIRDGDLDEVLPLESKETLEAANPVTADGQILFDPVVVKAREAEMARRIVAGGPVAIVVLGGEHDLTEALKATQRPFTYERLETPVYTKLAK